MLKKLHLVPWAMCVMVVRLWAADKVAITGDTAVNLYKDPQAKELRLKVALEGDCKKVRWHWIAGKFQQAVDVDGPEGTELVINLDKLRSGLTDGSQIKIAVTATGLDPCKLSDAVNVAVSKVRFQGGGLFERTILGLDWSGAASADSQNRGFANFYLSLPLGGRGQDRPFGPNLRLWLDTSLNTTAQQLAEAVTTNLAESGFAALLKKQKTNEVVQAAEVLGGIQYRIFSSPTHRQLFNLSGLSKTNVHLVAGAGMITPIDPLKTAVDYAFPQDGDSRNILFARFPDLKARANSNKVPYDYLTILAGDRKRFLREAYTGFRIQSHYYDDAGNPTTKPPTTVEFMVGVNESVTGGRMHGLAGRFGLFYPIQFQETPVYLFTTWNFRFKNLGPDQDALVLNAPELKASEKVDRTAATTALITASANQRDIWRVGIGFDLVRTIKNLAGNKKEAEDSGKDDKKESTPQKPASADKQPTRRKPTIF